MNVGRNRAPNHFIAASDSLATGATGGITSNLSNFIKCEAN